MAGFKSFNNAVEKSRDPSGPDSASGSAMQAFSGFMDALRGGPNATNKKIAEENLKYQRELQEYNKALQQQIFAREDSAYQRTVNDMRAAGLSALSMNGTDGAGEAVAQQPLHNGYVKQATASIFDMLGSVMNISSMAEQVRAQRLENDFQENTNIYRSTNMKAQSILSNYNVLSTREKQAYNSFFGLTDGMTSKEREYHVMAKLLGLTLNDYSGSGSKLRSGVEDVTKAIENFNEYSTPSRPSKEAVKRFIQDLKSGSLDIFESSVGGSDPLHIMPATEKIVEKRSEANLKHDEDVKKRGDAGEKLGPIDWLIYQFQKRGIK